MSHTNIVRRMVGGGVDLGELMDRARRAGIPTHLASRAFNDLLTEGAVELDEDQLVTATPTGPDPRTDAAVGR